MSKLHGEFDLNRWVKLFPIATMREEAHQFVSKRRAENPRHYRKETDFADHLRLMNPEGDHITSPISIAQVEQLRAEALHQAADNTVPTDVFIFAQGEPEKREVTKVGGLPYWPANKLWPKDKTGEPMPCIAQFNFSDSRDLVGRTPGDLLLIFLHGELGDDDPLHFEWLTIEQVPLVQPADVPKCNHWEILPCYGTIHRTVDYKVDHELLEEKYNQPWNITVIGGTKIGGIPSHIQDVSDEIGGRFLCSLGSVEPTSDKPRPFVNAEKPIDPFTRDRSKDYWMWGDAGSIFIYIDENGNVIQSAECY